MPVHESLPDRRPVIVVVDESPQALQRLRDELTGRYDTDYQLAFEPSPARVSDVLSSLAARGDDVALVLAAQWTGGPSCEDFWSHVHALHPRAKRALLIDFGAWADPRTADEIHRAMARGRMDYYVLKPWRTPDALFQRTVAELLHEWSRTDPRSTREMLVVGPQWSPKAHALRAQLGRNGVPHTFHPSDSAEGGRLLGEAGREGTDDPIVRTFDGRLLVDPSRAELARSYGVDTELNGERDFDVIVLGGGPAGLSAAVYAASEGLRTLVVEGEAIGGQAGSSSLIRNYLGFPRGISGAELAQRAYQQAWVFGTRFVLMQRATALGWLGDRHMVTLSDGSDATGRAIVIATGVSYRRLDIPSLDRLVGAGVFYGASTTEAQGLVGEDVFVVGGGNSAGQAARHLSRYARSVTLLVRGASLSEMSRYLCDEIEATGNLTVRLHTEVAGGGGIGRLASLVTRDTRTGERTTIPAAGLFVMIGARPHVAWLPPAIARDHAGYVFTGPDATGPERRGSPLMFETSMRGVFAIGDVRHGSVKRVASAAGEGSVVVQQVHQHLARRISTSRPMEAPEPVRR